MLEPLISSRIRRSLLEHFLSHPGERFYLRGLAKSLNLTVSPARRELLRLERMGVLTAYEEANVRFYVLNPASQIVAQLTVHQPPAEVAVQAVAPRSTPAATELAPSLPVRESRQPIGWRPTEPAQEASPARPPEWPVAATVLSHAKIERLRRALKPAAHWPTVLSAAAVTLVMLVVGAASYFEMTNRQWTTVAQKLLQAPRTQVTVIEQPAQVKGASASGEMRSSRWRIVPGGVGAFSY